MDAPIFHPHLTITLAHNGDCSLLGVTPEGEIYVEETYSDDAWLAQHAYAADGSPLRSVDEMGGANSHVRPLDLPDALVKPKTGWHTMILNYAGARHRGMRVEERLADVVQPLSVADKMALGKRLAFQPMQLIGVAESYVLAETELVRPSLFLTCRRIRFAFALPNMALDEGGEGYDYDTRVVYAAHLIDVANDEERPISAMLDDLPGLHRPMDCLLLGDRLYVADGGEGERLSRVCVWRVEIRKKPLSPDEALKKKIYG